MSLPLRREVARRLGLEAAPGADPSALRAVAYALNRARLEAAGDGEPAPVRVVHAGDLQAAAVLYDVLAEALDRSLTPAVVERLGVEIGDDAVDAVLRELDLEFGGDDTDTGPAARRARLERLLLIWLLNRNPALAAVREIFDDGRFARLAAYERIAAFVAGDPAAPEPVEAFALAEALSGSASLRDQLDLVLERWSHLDPGVRDRVLRARDSLAEDEVRPPPGPGPTSPP
ncbi:MAG: hypothetical protein R3190_08510, partial [Thermoanaerobaculia bacterium]|nr:hypothetical protein [Thermoanaerobaculia bacterium]